MSVILDTTKPPTVFISYSHDDKDHKAWVTTLASRLRENGVDVVLDHWDTEPGDDLAKFMERGVRDSDRVLMICTEKYVRKVDDGKGGAGYEAMIVSGELIADQGIRKFVPIVRQTAKKRIVPTALGTRKYIDLSEDSENPDAQFAELLESIHKVIAQKKPPLGPNPFAATVPLRGLDLSGGQPEISSEPAKKHQDAIELIQSQNRPLWRRMLQGSVIEGEQRLLNWKTENQDQTPTFDEHTPEPWLSFFGRGISSYDPLIASLIAAAEVGDPEYSGQLGWIDLVLEPNNWEKSGSTVWTELPRAILFSLQSYFGAMLMRSGGAEQAVKLAMTPIRDPWHKSETSPLFLTSNVSSWIDTFGGNCVVSWNYLNLVGDKSKWLVDAFGSEENIKSGRTAYYMLLSFMEFVKDASKEEWKFNVGNFHFEVSHMFVRSTDSVQIAAFNLLMENKATLMRMLEGNGIDRDKLEKTWPDWVAGMKRWATQLRDGYYARWSTFPLERLPSELFRDPFNLRNV